jgi:hypothetical protein
LTDLTELTAGEILLSGKMSRGELFAVEKLLPGEVDVSEGRFAKLEAISSSVLSAR